MKKNIFFVGLIFATLSVLAIPARKGTYRTLTLANGDTIAVLLCGDEYCHYWMSDDGRTFTVDSTGIASELNTYDFELLKSSGLERKTAINNVRRAKMTAASKTVTPERVGTFPEYTGKKKGLVILASFKDLAFQDSDSVAHANIDAMFNEVGYSKNGHIGSVHDYFYDQSYKLFDLEFDVVGPVNLSRNYSYYGKNNGYGNDSHPCTLVIEACDSIDSIVNFADYDWDGDGYVEQVYVVYAGHGEHASNNSNFIWPHEWNLSSGQYFNDGAGPQEYDGVTVDTYAMSCELCGGTSSKKLDGIGTACHEFSHCLGYPDFYDTDYSGGWGMNSWDILDQGSYNGPNGYGEIPAGYSSYERWVAGWVTPQELVGGEEIDSMKSLVDAPEAYIIYNDSVPTEYYMLECRKPVRWYQYLDQNMMTKTGMLVLHVDYDEDAWYNDTPNDDPSHQRMTIVPANNLKSINMTKVTYAGNLYPYNNNDSLTNWSVPATETFNKNKNRKKFLPVSISDINVNADSTISFNADKAYFIPVPVPVPADTPVDTLKDDVIFYETFDKCNGKGGNDGSWNGSIATSALLTDNDGWSSGFGAYQCARFGTTSKAASVTAPTIDYIGEVKISFKAAAWNNAKDGTDLTICINNDEIQTFTMKKDDWTTYSFYLPLSGPSTLKFNASLRMFLDDVGVAKYDPTGIEDVNDGSSLITYHSSLYNISGQRVSEDYKGIIIKNGRKILKK